MAVAAPPLLPTSVPSAAPAPDIASADPGATWAFLSRLLDSAKHSLSGARPWPELLVALSLAVSLLAHPYSLAALLALLAAWCLVYILRPA